MSKKSLILPSFPEAAAQMTKTPPRNILDSKISNVINNCETYIRFFEREKNCPDRFDEVIEAR